MDVVNYFEKRVLIIEDLAQMRASMKSMLDTLGVRDIDTAVSGDQGIDMLAKKDYNLVLSDYDLGRGKDGQQVLEECRAGGLLKASSVFVMITAAQTVEMVMGALEYEPDGYIAKPVTLDNLRARLNKILKLKMIFENINDAIDDDDLDLAVENCNKLITQKPKFALPTYRIKGNLLIRLKQFRDAEELYRTVMDIRDLGWAKLGLAKALFHQKKYEESLPYLNDLAETSQRFVESLDWLAKIYEAQGDKEKAQEALVEAVERSPKAVLRQQELSRVSTENGDWKVSIQSSRKAVALGRHSCYKNPGSYLMLATSLQEQIKNGSMRDKTYASNEALKALDTLRKDYEDKPDILVKAYSLQSKTFHNLGKKQEAINANDKARQKFLENAEALSPSLIQEIANNYVEAGYEQGALSFQEEDAVQARLNSRQSNEMIDNVQDKAIEIKRARIDNFNNMGVELFEKGKLKQAIEMFEMAADEPLASTAVLLNVVQALLADCQKSNKSTGDEKRQAIQDYFDRITDINEEDSRFARYSRLKNMLDSMRSS